MRHTKGIGGLASGFIKLIPDHVDMLQPAAKSQVAEHVLDVTALALAAETGKDKPAVSSGRAVALLQLRMAIESRLSDPALDPSSAAAAAGISVRYANVLLSGQGTSLQRLIVSRRLDHCRRALEDPGQSHRTITEIAFAWGFSSGVVFMCLGAAAGHAAVSGSGLTVSHPSALVSVHWHHHRCWWSHRHHHCRWW